MLLHSCRLEACAWGAGVRYNRHHARRPAATAATKGGRCGSDVRTAGGPALRVPAGHGTAYRLHAQPTAGGHAAVEMSARAAACLGAASHVCLSGDPPATRASRLTLQLRVCCYLQRPSSRQNRAKDAASSAEADAGALTVAFSLLPPCQPQCPQLLAALQQALCANSPHCRQFRCLSTAAREQQHCSHAALGCIAASCVWRRAACMRTATDRELRPCLGQVLDLRTRPQAGLFEGWPCPCQSELASQIDLCAVLKCPAVPSPTRCMLCA